MALQLHLKGEHLPLQYTIALCKVNIMRGVVGGIEVLTPFVIDVSGQSTRVAPVSVDQAEELHTRFCSWCTTSFT